MPCHPPQHYVTTLVHNVIIVLCITALTALFSAAIQAAIQDRFEAWAPLTEAQFKAYTPRRMQLEKEAALAAEQAVALRPVHFALPVPADRGQQRVAVHGMMRRPPGHQRKAVKKAEVGLHISVRMLRKVEGC